MKENVHLLLSISPLLPKTLMTLHFFSPCHRPTYIPIDHACNAANKVDFAGGKESLGQDPLLAALLVACVPQFLLLPSYWDGMGTFPDPSR